MTNVLIMGKKIGLCDRGEHMETENSLGIQLYSFIPADEFSHLPTCEVLYIDLLNGTFVEYDENDNAQRKGIVFK